MSAITRIKTHRMGPKVFLAVAVLATLVTSSPALGQKGGPPEAAASSQNLKAPKRATVPNGHVGKLVQTHPPCRRAPSAWY